jgi:prepilin-type N-terminal cleavage/methylation domain-containing protein
MKGFTFIEWFIVMVIVGIVAAIFRIEFSTGGKERRAEQQKEEEAERQPHVVREADGCKVYAFKHGESLHFFTRCPNSSTTTDTTHRECRLVGKVTRCEDKITTIQTVEEVK